jgi:hypothetical protein
MFSARTGVSRLVALGMFGSETPFTFPAFFSVVFSPLSITLSLPFHVR